MKKTLFALAALFLLPSIGAANPMWKDLKPAPSARQEAGFLHRSVQADFNALRQQLWQAPAESSSLPPVIIDLPLPDGSFISMNVHESPIMSGVLQKKFPGIKTFKAYDAQNPANSGRLDITPRGFHAMLRTKEGIVYISPESGFSNYSEPDRYRSFKRSSLKPSGSFTCSTRDHNHSEGDFTYLRAAVARLPVAGKNFGSNLRTYRLALSATAEYSQAVADGNLDDTWEEMVIAINRVNEIYEKDLSIRLSLVTGTELISTDPNDFSNDDGDSMLAENQLWVDNITGSSNYDIGHIFSTGGGGLAQVGSVCDGDGDGIDEYKAQGVTGLANPVGNEFYIDYVAHEIGHQFGATHTFNASGPSSGDCNGNRVDTYLTGSITYLASSAYEPGSGSTIMGYAGICNDQNLQANSDPYFHARSIEQVRQLVDGDIAAAEPGLFWADGSICGTGSATGDSIPVANAGNDYTIPANTPFVLTGTGADADSEESTFIYTWEQYNLGSATTSLTEMHTDRGNGPLIRSRQGSNSPQRFIPTLDAIIAGTLSANTGERLPTTDRSLKFRLTLRTGSNGVSQDEMLITSDKDSGPFVVTGPTSSGTMYGLSAVDVTWNTANTNFSPVNCSEVDISLSTDGGQKFPLVLMSETANDGSESVTLPDISTAKGRIKVQCSGNIFFNISPEDFSITSISGAGSILSISGPSATKEGDTGTTAFLFSILRTGDTSGISSVDYLVSGSGNNPAVSDDFYGSVFASGTIEFANGESTKTISVLVAGDMETENDEAFMVTIFNPENSSIATGSATVSILNDEKQGGSGDSSGGWISLLTLWLMLATLFLRRPFPAF